MFLPGLTICVDGRSHLDGSPDFQTHARPAPRLEDPACSTNGIAVRYVRLGLNVCLITATFVSRSERPASDSGGGALGGRMQSLRERINHGIGFCQAPLTAEGLGKETRKPSTLDYEALGSEARLSCVRRASVWSFAEGEANSQDGCEGPPSSEPQVPPARQGHADSHLALVC